MPIWRVHKGSSLFKYVAYPVVLPASLPRLSVHGTGFIIHVSQIFPQMSRGVHRNPIHHQCKHILVCQLSCSRLSKLGIFIRRSIYIYQQMQDFLDEYESRSRGVQRFDIATRWLFGMQIQLPAFAAFSCLVADKSRSHSAAPGAASAFKQRWPLGASAFIYALYYLWQGQLLQQWRLFVRY